MKIFSSLEEIKNIGETAVALGSFDGVHLGHRMLVEFCVREGKKQNLIPSVFTFSNHPRDLIPGGVKAKNILYKKEKERIMEELGVEYLFDIPFTEEIMKTAPRDYVSKLLVGRCRAKLICCGFNHRFGYKAQGTPELLGSMEKEEGYETYVLEPFKINGNLVSSSFIRELILSGEVDKCPEYMGRYYAVEGEVVVGNRLGKSLGFPTSNLIIDEEMVTPPNGVYVTYCIYNGKKYPSITNVGVRPTVGDFKKNIETHIFDFDKELYGKHITVEFLAKTRDEIKFGSIEELSAQIIKDCQKAKEFHLQQHP